MMEGQQKYAEVQSQGDVCVYVDKVRQSLWLAKKSLFVSNGVDLDLIYVFTFSGSFKVQSTVANHWGFIMTLSH